VKKILAVVMIISTLSSLLAFFPSCEKENPEEAPEKCINISEYSIVRAFKASSNLVKATLALRNKILDLTEIKLSVSDDWYKEGEAPAESVKEILIGNTNRKESAAAKEKLDSQDDENSFIIEANGSKIVILGKNDEVTVRALKYFIKSFIAVSEDKNAVSMDASYSYIGLADMSTSVFYETLLEFRISEKSVVYDPGEYATKRAIYPTIYQLNHQSDEKNNGTLLATLNSGESFYRILRSRDNGDTWEETARVSDTYNKDINAGRMPFIYELPVDMGEFKKGTILLAGTSSKSDKNLTTITLYASTDLGESWKTLYNIDYGGGQYDGSVQVDLGVWEPYFIYDENDGRLYCFYSDDSSSECDQKLVYKYTTDMKNWVGKEGIKGANGSRSTPFDVVACEDYDFRPGMISVVKMNNGKYFAVYDIVVYAPGRPAGVVNGISGNPDFYKISDSLDSWDVSDPGTLVKLEDGRYMGLSPWCTYSGTIGEAGMLVVYGRKWSEKTNYDQTDLFLSFDYGETFIPFENPFKYVTSLNGKNTYCGYSPTLLFSEDGKTLYYMNNTLSGKNDQTTRIEMVRIDIIE